MKPDRFLLKVWRWHFYAGLFTLPFLFILALTGIVYLFRVEIEDFVYRDRIVTESSSTGISLEQQKANAQKFLPDASLLRVIPPAQDNRSTAFAFKSPEGKDVTVFVRPSDGTVLGKRDESWRPSTIAVKLHGELMVGKTGDILMELAASWSILLVLSGLYLWIPRSGNTQLRGILIPRIRNTDSRTRWRDLHAVTGFWMAGILVFFSVTGLFWSGFWGAKMVKPWNTFPAAMYNDVPLSGQSNRDLNGADAPLAAWAVEDEPVPESRQKAAGEDHSHHGGSQNFQADSAAVAPQISLDDIQKLATDKGVLASRVISLPQSEKGVYTVNAVVQSSFDEAILHVDQYSGEILADIRYEDYSPAARAVAISIALHEGRFFGPVNKALAFLACLLVLLLTVSAAVLWWRRRPSLRSLAAPSRVTLPAFWKGAACVVCIFAVVFPLAGLSLVAVLLLDTLVVKRVEARRLS